MCREWERERERKQGESKWKEEKGREADSNLRSVECVEDWKLELNVCVCVHVIFGREDERERGRERERERERGRERMKNFQFFLKRRKSLFLSKRASKRNQVSRSADHLQGRCRFPENFFSTDFLFRFRQNGTNKLIRKKHSADFRHLHWSKN